MFLFRKGRGHSSPSLFLLDLFLFCCQPPLLLPPCLIPLLNVASSTDPSSCASRIPVEMRSAAEARRSPIGGGGGRGHGQRADQRLAGLPVWGRFSCLSRQRDQTERTVTGGWKTKTLSSPLSSFSRSLLFSFAKSQGHLVSAKTCVFFSLSSLCWFVLCDVSRDTRLFGHRCLQPCLALGRLGFLGRCSCSEC